MTAYISSFARYRQFDSVAYLASASTRLDAMISRVGVMIGNADVYDDDVWIGKIGRHAPHGDRVSAHVDIDGIVCAASIFIQVVDGRDKLK